MLKCLIIFVFLLKVTLALENSNRRFRVVNGSASGKLVGDEVVNFGEFPYIVRIKAVRIVIENGKWYRQSSLCGGAILKLDVIITAAHCVYRFKPWNITVEAGIVSDHFQENTAQTQSVAKIVIHGKYNANNRHSDHDIAVIFLRNRLRRTKFVKQLSFPKKEDYHLGRKVISGGWGVDSNGEQTKWLQKSKMIISASSWCEVLTGEKFSANKICVIGEDSMVCKGDSGAPLVRENRLVGIASATAIYELKREKKKTCYPEMPAEYMNVANYANWIREQITLFHQETV